MSQVYEPVMGLEIHVELNTKSKMFCRCSADYHGQSPNTHTCPVCLGLPGALPYANQEAITKCVQIGLALGCRVQNISLFERKNYFYPDLPKGYQISQLRWPLNVNGELMVSDQNGVKQVIRINRVHQEEDTGKLTHQGSETVIDYNRSGVPLVEIVTEPDFVDPIQVRNYAKLLQQIFRDLGVSEADMEKGQMRLEANISVRPVGQKELPNYRVELKNINSFRFMVAAVEYEIERQTKALSDGEELKQETRGWDEAKQKTFVQRSKEEANDYRYFPEPDLPRLELSQPQINKIKSEMPKLSYQLLDEYATMYGLSPAIVASFSADPLKLIKFGQSVELAVGLPVTPTSLASVWSNVKSDDVEKLTPEEVIKQVQTKAEGRVGDEGQIREWAESVVSENPGGAVEAYKAGRESAIQVLIGGVMRKSEGKADAEKAAEILRELLK